MHTAGLPAPEPESVMKGCCQLYACMCDLSHSQRQSCITSGQKEGKDRQSEGSQAFFPHKSLSVLYNFPESLSYIRLISLEPRSSFCPILPHCLISCACWVPRGYGLRTEDSDPHLGSPCCWLCVCMPVLSTHVLYSVE